MKRALISLVAIVAVVVMAFGAYGYFTAPGSGTETALTASGTFGAPTVDPAGAPAFSLTDLAPGQSATQSLTVTAPGGGPSPTQIALYQQTASGTLLSQLNLKVVEDGTTTIYDGPLDTGWTPGSPFPIPGNLTSGLWAAGEQHTFAFTVTLSATAPNTFQSTNAGTSFVWQRTQG